MIDVSTLLDEAKCFTCFNLSLADTLKLALLARISGGGSTSPKVYRALLNQTGSNPPTAIVLENTLGGTPLWSYSDVGSYTITLNGAFPSNKVFSTSAMCADTSVFLGLIAGGETTYPDKLNFRTSGGVDDVLVQTSVEILVYP